MKQHESVPMVVVVVSLLLGCYDLLRGLMRTIFLHYSAPNIAGLDLSDRTASHVFWKPLEFPTVTPGSV